MRIVNPRSTSKTAKGSKTGRSRPTRRLPERVLSSSKKEVKPTPPPTHEQKAMDAVFDEDLDLELEVEEVSTIDIDTDMEDISSQKEKEVFYPALDALAKDVVSKLWTERALHFRDKYLSAIIDLYASLNALQDIQDFFQKSGLDGSNQVLTAETVEEHERIINDVLASVLIQEFQVPDEVKHRLHAALLFSRKSIKQGDGLAQMKKFLEGMQHGEPGLGPYGDTTHPVATKFSYDNK